MGYTPLPGTEKPPRWYEAVLTVLILYAVAFAFAFGAKLLLADLAEALMR